jgi:glycosyltransferase involved in cell wall biosynthesis
VKIALVRKDFSPKGGGGERYSVDLARAFRDFGHEVHIFAHRYEPMKGISFHTVAVPLKPFGSAGPGFSATFMTKFLQDIVYCST